MTDWPNLHDATLIALVTKHVRAPSGAGLDEAGVLVMTFDPPLTVEEWDRIRPELLALRNLRQMGRAAFMALTAAERDRLIYDALVSQAIIDLALLRD